MPGTGLTPVDMVNLALLQLGDQQITSFEDGTTLSQSAALVYPQARDIILEAHPWNFATQYATLQRLADAPAWGFTYAYSLPTDPYCLRVMQLELNEPFEVASDGEEGRVLLTDAATGNARILVRVENLLAWNALAREALVECLGKMLAAAITGQQTRRAALLDEMAQWIEVAQRRDAQEGTPHVLPPNRLLITQRHQRGAALIPSRNPTWW